MLEIERKLYRFKIKDIWWANEPYNIKDYDGVTFHACKNKTVVEGFRCLEFTTLVIDLSQDLDVIWKNMSQSSCRRFINRAIREKIKIKLNQNYEEFYLINKLFRKNKNLNSSFINIEFMKKYGTLFVAEYNGEILGGIFYLEDKDNIRGWYGATKRLEADKEIQKIAGDANRLIHWEAIKYAKVKGKKEYDFGGFYTGKIKEEQKENINNFKKSFGGKLTTHYIYKKDSSKIYKFLRYLYNFMSI